LYEPLDGLLTRHRALTLRFPAALATQPSIPGALWWSGEGTEWTCLCNGEVADVRRSVEGAGAQVVEERAPSLEEIFLARTRLGGQQPATSGQLE